MLQVAIDIAGAVAKIVAAQGREFNAELIKQFDATWNPSRDHDLNLGSESVLFYQAIASSLGWLQAYAETVSLPPIYFDFLADRRLSKGNDVEEELRGIKLRRRTAVVAALKTWRKVELPSEGDGPFDLEELQRRALQASGVRWSSMAALKQYAMLRYRDLPIPEAIYLPLGRRTSTGIQHLLGLNLGESEHDYELARQIHVAWAKLSGATVLEINSGFYRLGGGV